MDMLNVLNFRQRAFTLTEAILAMVLIGGFVAITVPMIGKVTSTTKETTTLRNAQALASTAGQARHAGNTSVSFAATKEDAIKLLSEGVYGEGEFSGTRFHVGLDAGEQEEVAEFVDFENGLMTFKRKP